MTKQQAVSRVVYLAFTVVRDVMCPGETRDEHYNAALRLANQVDAMLHDQKFVPLAQWRATERELNALITKMEM